MYDAASDPYCYPGTTVLRNIPDLRTQEALDAFETAAVAQRADEPLPAGRFSVTHYRALHRHLFQDVYAWAGSYRTVRMSKDGSAFCYPEYIRREMKDLFAGVKKQSLFQHLSAVEFAGQASRFLSTLNAIHPFREGNGRTQLLIVTLVAAQAGHPFDLDRLDAKTFMQAMVKSFRGELAPLTKHSRELTAV